MWYKREFEWPDVLRLWESLWTDWLSSNFHIFIALAILEKHRDVIMAHLKHFDEVLKYGMYRVLPLVQQPLKCQELLMTTPVNELSNTMDLSSTLLRAQALFRRFQRTVDAIDKKRNFPAPTVRQRKPVRPEPAAGSSARPQRNISTSKDTSSGAPGKGKAKVEEDVKKEEEKVISPELRTLLSKKIITVEK